MERRREDGVVEREADLDQRRDPCGALSVADLGLHGAEGARAYGGAVIAEDLRHRLHLCAVADDGARAVCFHEPELVAGNSRAFPCALHGAHLALEAGRGHAEALTIARSGAALDDRIDVIAVALCIFETL